MKPNYDEAFYLICEHCGKRWKISRGYQGDIEKCMRCGGKLKPEEKDESGVRSRRD
jgi:DNA-directed RNA polymerase subunit M/transcription elongation factor TFIIS